MASKTLLVAQREYLENVRTKTFWIGIFIVPILIALSVGGGALLKRFKEVQSYTVVDLSGGGLRDRAEHAFRQADAKTMYALAAKAKDDPAFADLRKKLGDMKPGDTPSGEQTLAVLDWMARQDPKVLQRFHDLDTSRRFTYVPLEELDVPADAEARTKALNERVRDGKLFAYFVLGKDAAATFDDFAYVSNNLTDDSLKSAYGNTLTALVQADRIAQANIPPKVADHIQQRIEWKSQQVDASGEASDVKRENVVDKWAPVGFVYFLWIAIFSIANLLLTNTIEEKSNRIIEVLLSSVSPKQLMHGKIWGIAATGLTIVGTWVVFGTLAAVLAPKLLGDSSGMIGALVTALSNSSYLFAFVAYFLGGFLLYASVLVALGSVCNTLKEAQNLMQPVMMLLMVPLISMVFVTQEPNGLVARVLSFIPLFTPFTMMNRAGGPPETWEYVVTSLLLLGTILFTMRAAGKVFRVGILMTGKPPKLKEILGWLREK